MRAATLNAMLQFLVIYRFVNSAQSISSPQQSQILEWNLNNSNKNKNKNKNKELWTSTPILYTNNEIYKTYFMNPPKYNKNTINPPKFPLK